MDHFARFDFEKFYHVFNRSNNKETVFLTGDNYVFFLKKFDKYLGDYLHVYSYCLLPNHFHFLVQVKSEADITTLLNGATVDAVITEQFRMLFISYSMAFNKQQFRNGNLFHRRFKRLTVDSDVYFTQLIYYIHLNPVKHGLTHDYSNYRWSSYRKLMENVPNKLQREAVLEWFGGKERFEDYHRQMVDLINPGLMVEE